MHRKKPPVAVFNADACPQVCRLERGRGAEEEATSTTSIRLHSGAHVLQTWFPLVTTQCACSPDISSQGSLQSAQVFSRHSSHGSLQNAHILQTCIPRITAECSSSTNSAAAACASLTAPDLPPEPCTQFDGQVFCQYNHAPLAGQRGTCRLVGNSHPAVRRTGCGAPRRPSKDSHSQLPKSRLFPPRA